MTGADAPRTDGPLRLTRRGLLAAMGTGALAGCQSIDDIGGGDDPTIRSYDLPDVDTESIPAPVVPPSVPVDVAPAYFASTRDRVTSLLSDLPTPLSPTDIPNGYVRHHLTDAADDATDRLDEARTARTQLVALQSLQEARDHARYASAGWAFANSGLSVESLHQEHSETVGAAQSMRDDHTYLGTDPVRATLVHARIESCLDRVTRSSDHRTHAESALLTVAEWGGTAESAQATLDDARHLTDQFTDSLPDDAGPVEDVVTRAAETLLADVRSQMSDLPPEPTAEEWGVAENVVDDLRWRAGNGSARLSDATGPASAVLDATRRLTMFRALDRVQDRIDAGEIAGVESAAAFRETRTAAYDALDASLQDSPAPGITRTVVSDVSWRVTNADRSLERFTGDVSTGQLDDLVKDYVVTAAIARAAPAASRKAVDALDES